MCSFISCEVGTDGNSAIVGAIFLRSSSCVKGCEDPAARTFRTFAHSTGIRNDRPSIWQQRSPDFLYNFTRIPGPTMIIYGLPNNFNSTPHKTFLKIIVALHSLSKYEVNSSFTFDTLQTNRFSFTNLIS